MIKPNSILRRKWFQITAVGTASFVIAGGAIGGGVAAAIIDVATKRAKETVSDLGITPDPGSKSDIDKGLFASGDAKVNVVALGDSVTAGYTTLSYTKQVPTANPDGTVGSNKVYVAGNGVDTYSYADYVAANLSSVNKLGSYNSLAVSGQTSSGMLDTLTSTNNLPIIAKANLIMITIGANDILRAVKLLGVPFSQFASILTDPFGTTRITSEKKNTSLADLVTVDANGTPATTSISNATYLPALFTSLQNVLTNGPEKLFSVDVPTLDVELVNALSNVLKALTFIHQKAPKAKIILNEYQFPFNRYVHDGVNITEVEDPSLASVTFNGKAINKKTLRGVYDYVMDNFKDKATAAFGVVTWNSLQDNQDALIKNLTTLKDANGNIPIESKDEALALFQRDLTDIHPTEYSHALIGQHIYNTYLAPLLITTAQNNGYEYLKTAIASSKTPAKSDPMIGFFKFILNFKKPAVKTDANQNAADGSEVYTFARKLVEGMIEEVKVAANVASLDKIDFTKQATLGALLNTGSIGMLRALSFVQGGSPTTEQGFSFLNSIDKFINTIMFNPSNTEIRDVFEDAANKGAFNATPEFTRDPAHARDFYGLLGTIVAEAALARVSPFSSFNGTAVQEFVAEALKFSYADRRSLETAMALPANVLGTAANPIDTAAEVGGAVARVYGWLESLPVLPTDADPYPSAPTATKTAATTLINMVKTNIKTNKIYTDAAQRLVSNLTSDEKTALLASFNNSTIPRAALDDVAVTAWLISKFAVAGLVTDESQIPNSAPETAKAVIKQLIIEIKQAVAYANGLATAFPAVFFTNYATDGLTETLKLADLRRSITDPAILGQLVKKTATPPASTTTTTNS